MKLNKLIDISTDNYYLNPYKLNNSDLNHNKNTLLSDSDINLNLILKTLTSIIMTNSKITDNNDIVQFNKNIKSNNSDTINNDKINNFDKFIIFKLVANNNIDKLKNLLEKNNLLDINIQDDDGDTALHIAIFLSNIEACDILIKHNANIFIRDKWGQSPLHRLCFSIENKNLMQIINLIDKHNIYNDKLDNKNIFNCVDKFNNTPIHLVIKYILKNKIKLNKNIISIIHRLISLSNINLVNNDGLSGSDLISMLNLSK
jgi:ankyrin repeat protein